MDSYPNSTESILPPHDGISEAGTLACILLANGEAVKYFRQLQLEYFYDIRHQEIYKALRSLDVEGKPIDSVGLYQRLRDSGRVEEAGGFSYIAELPDMAASPEQFESFFATVADRAARRSVIRDATELNQLANNPSNSRGQIIEAARRMGEAYARHSTESLESRLEARLFRVDKQFPTPTPRYRIHNTPICTAGNITSIYGPPKTAKTAVIGAMMAATIADASADCLGFISQNPEGLALVHLDSELSLADHHNHNLRNARRANAAIPPAWWRSYCLTEFAIGERRAAIPLLLENAAGQFGGVHSLMLDGAADFITDVNDPEQSNIFVSELHAFAIKFNCAVVCVIHQNPGTEKTRGHLGSQLERKSESNLRLERDGESVIIWSEKNRGAPIPKTSGPRFMWSDDLKMFVSTECAADAKAEAERAELLEQAESVFALADKSALKWADFITSLARDAQLSHNGARKRMAKMLKAVVIKKELAGLYTLAQ